MTRKKIWGVLSLSVMLILIIDSRNAIAGAIKGLELCLYTVIPALFPYCVLSIIFQNSVLGSEFKLLRPLERICKLPVGSGIVFILGILGGYPSGAICTERAGLDKNTASNMAIFCNNAGPSFIFGVISIIYKNRVALTAIWLIQIISALIVGIILNKNNNPDDIRPRPTNYNANPILDAVKAMANVCGTIVIFRVIINCLEPVVAKFIPIQLYAVLIGITELTNSITYLNEISHEAIRFMLCCGLLSFGGVCVALQTVFVCSSTSFIKYLSGKALQGIISMIIAGLLVYNAWILLVFLLLFLIVIINKSIKKKKAVAFL